MPIATGATCVLLWNVGNNHQTTRRHIPPASNINAVRCRTHPALCIQHCPAQCGATQFSELLPTCRLVQPNLPASRRTASESSSRCSSHSHCRWGKTEPQRRALHSSHRDSRTGGSLLNARTRAQRMQHVTQCAQ